VGDKQKNCLARTSAKCMKRNLNT